MKIKYLGSRTCSAAVLLVALGTAPGNVYAQGVMGAGTEDRDWIAEPLDDALPAEQFEVELFPNTKVTMRDGIVLDALLYVPVVDEPRGCLLVADGYGWSEDPRDLRFAETRGYALLNLSMRGIHESEGEAALYDKFGEDGYDAIEWMAEQEWCNGNVGMYGSSLPGIPQWLIANEHPPSLRAIAPDVACADCYTMWYPGGMLPGPGRENRARHEYLAAIEHRDFNDWWDAQTVDDTEMQALADSNIAMMVTGGWADYITPDNVDSFGKFASMGGDGRMFIDAGAHMSARRSILGPWHHEQHMDLFFQHYLDGVDNAWTDGTYRGDVIIWINGADQFRYEETWPLPDARDAVLYLASAPSGSIESLNDGSLAGSPNEGGENAEYTYFPESGPFLPAMRTSGQGIPQADTAPYEVETLTWTTDALTDATEVTGNIVVDFWASADTGDTDFVVLISEVAEDGTATFVTTGFLNAARYPDRRNPQPLEDGEIREFQIVAQPIAHVFQPGNRIRISLAGGAEGTPDQGTPQGPGKNPNFANVTIYQDAEHPSAVTFPVIGSAELPNE